MPDITVDRQKCIGSGNCTIWATGTFELGDDGIAFVTDPTANERGALEMAVQNCPSGAISVTFDAKC